MVKLKHSEMRAIDDAFGMGSGYVLDFSDRTFSEFFDDEFRLNIYDEKYGFNGTSKAKHLRAFITVEEAHVVCGVLRSLWEHRSTLEYFTSHVDTAKYEKRLFDLIIKLEAGDSALRTDAIDRFAANETLDELVGSIERDIAANKPVAALDRLHTYCMKKFGYLLDQHGVAWERTEPLHSRVGKYVKVIESKAPLSDTSRQIIKGSFGVFDKFNHVRNNASLAHDNELAGHSEARFIFESISAFLRFVRAIERSA